MSQQSWLGTPSMGMYVVICVDQGGVSASKIQLETGRVFILAVKRFHNLQQIEWIDRPMGIKLVLQSLCVYLESFWDKEHEFCSIFSSNKVYGVLDTFYFQFSNKFTASVISSLFFSLFLSLSLSLPLWLIHSLTQSTPLSLFLSHSLIFLSLSFFVSCFVFVFFFSFRSFFHFFLLKVRLFLVSDFFSFSVPWLKKSWNTGSSLAFKAFWMFWFEI